MEKTKINNFVIIIQARLGSTRLPFKMKLPFWEGKGIAEVITDNLLKFFNKSNIIVATTNTVNDDELANLFLSKGIRVFRGEENNVLKRFVDCGISINADLIIRVCADNPFIDPASIKRLMDNYTGDEDYISYILSDGTPSIKSHLGFYAELVKLDALKSIISKTNETKYTEHVTNFIYENASQFKIKWLNPDEIIDTLNSIRLTIDTQEDFVLCGEIYETLEKNGIDLQPINIIKFIEQRKDYLERMKGNIARNQK